MALYTTSELPIVLRWLIMLGWRDLSSTAGPLSATDLAGGLVAGFEYRGWIGNAGAPSFGAGAGASAMEVAGGMRTAKNTISASSITDSKLLATPLAGQRQL